MSRDELFGVVNEPLASDILGVVMLAVADDEGSEWERHHSGHPYHELPTITIQAILSVIAHSKKC